MKKFLDKISSKYNKLPPSQRKVAEYFFHHLNDAILSNTMQIAKKAGVSEATVIRCVNSIGFASFSQFKRIIGQKVLEGASTSRRLIDSSETLKSSQSLFMDIISGDIEKIGELDKTITEKIFHQAVNKLCGARNLYVLGLRSSYALAFYLAFDLRFFLDSVRLIELGVGDIPEQVRDINPSDVLVAISFKRYTRKTVEIAKTIKQKGAYIIAITNSELSPTAQIADLALIADTKIPAYFESYTAPMSLLNALITAIALKHKDKAIPMLDRLEEEFENFDTFIH
jgi:DNA-binding MurR/RpiR family transcriptional regulator